MTSLQKVVNDDYVCLGSSRAPLFISFPQDGFIFISQVLRMCWDLEGFSSGTICLFLCTNRCFHTGRGQHLHQILQSGYGGFPAGRVLWEPGLRQRVVRLVLSHSLALLQPGGGHWPAANAGGHNNSNEGTLWFWCNNRHVVGWLVSKATSPQVQWYYCLFTFCTVKKNSLREYCDPTSGSRQRNVGASWLYVIASIDT